MGFPTFHQGRIVSLRLTTLKEPKTTSAMVAAARPDGVGGNHGFRVPLGAHCCVIAPCRRPAAPASLCLALHPKGKPETPSDPNRRNRMGYKAEERRRSSAALSDDNAVDRRFRRLGRVSIGPVRPQPRKRGLSAYGECPSSVSSADTFPHGGRQVRRAHDACPLICANGQSFKG